MEFTNESDWLAFADDLHHPSLQERSMAGWLQCISPNQVIHQLVQGGVYFGPTGRGVGNEGSELRESTRAQLLTEVWGASADQQTRTVDMTIANLRQKIETDPSSPRIVVTVKGVGYAWGPE